MSDQPPPSTPPPPPDNPNPDESSSEAEALRLKALAGRKYASSKLKSALKYAKRAHRLSPSLPDLAAMLAAFKILHAAAAAAPDSPNWYAILDLEPFSHPNSIKKNYKNLALILHPDKSSHAAAAEAFRVLNDAWEVLSDKIRRKEYDTKLRVSIQEANTETIDVDEDLETFWTACGRCRLLHEFERKYIGEKLVCPNCNQSFVAVEVEDGEQEEGIEGEGLDSEEDSVRRSGRVKGKSETDDRVSTGVIRGKSDANGRVSIDTMSMSSSKRKVEWVEGREVVLGISVEFGEQIVSVADVNSSSVSRSTDNASRSTEKVSRSGSSKLVEESEKGRNKRGKADEELTLAEMQFKLRQVTKKDDGKEAELKGRQLGEIGIGDLVNGGDMVVMPVEDSDFYDFDKDRVERSFKKGQVWAIYDDDDGMPRHYGLIDEVVSVNPFQVNMSWLDLQNHGDEKLMMWENLGFHVSCGRFKVARKDTINLLNIFSHVVDCERAAKEVYWIYPKKGSVWALYAESSLDAVENGHALKDKRSYDIVMFLTSYSPMYGLSMAYLEKVDGFKSVFKRRDMGMQSIKWIEKDDFRLFSHQIPARKLSGDEVPDRLKDCWELDPASLPADMLTITYDG